jgi:hypothetical protein
MAELHRPHGGDMARGGTDNPATHHEESDVNIRGILMFAATLIVAAIVIHLLVYVLFRYLNDREGRPVALEYPLAAAQGNRVPPEPRLQTNPRQDLADLRAREDATLTSYSWVDKNAGIVRIPIDEAVKLTLQRGLPARQQGKP